MPCKKGKPPYSEQQRQWAYAAEERGELPGGTAKKWSRRVEDKDLPEKKSSQNGMFFANRVTCDDGMFMKEAQVLQAKEQPKKLLEEKKLKKTFAELPSGEKEPLPVKPKKTPPPDLIQRKPEPLPIKGEKPVAMMGCGRTKKANVQLGYPGTGLSGSAPFGAIPAGTGVKPPSSMYGVGKKPILKKHPMKKESADEDVAERLKSLARSAGRGAESVAQRLGKTLGTVAGGAEKAVKRIPGYAEKGLRGIEDLPPEAHAAIMAALGYGGYRAAKKGVRGATKGVSRLAGKAKAPPPGITSRLSRALRALRGR